MFSEIAPRYDLRNRLLSFGADLRWRRRAVDLALEKAPKRILDLATGTGDLALMLKERAPGAEVVGADFAPPMLAIARRKAEARGLEVRFLEADALALPFPDGAFDAVTIAFGIRNVPRIDKALAEAHRVLKRGGRFLCLEFSHVDVPLLDKIYETYSFKVIPPMGRMVTGEAEPYQYLVESIRKFPKPQAFANMIEDAGFRRAKFTPMTGGVVALHSGWKL